MGHGSPHPHTEWVGRVGNQSSSFWWHKLQVNEAACHKSLQVTEAALVPQEVCKSMKQLWCHEKFASQWSSFGATISLQDNEAALVPQEVCKSMVNEAALLPQNCNVQILFASPVFSLMYVFFETHTFVYVFTNTYMSQQFYVAGTTTNLHPFQEIKVWT